MKNEDIGRARARVYLYVRFYLIDYFAFLGIVIYCRRQEEEDMTSVAFTILLLKKLFHFSFLISRGVRWGYFVVAIKYATIFG